MKRLFIACCLSVLAWPAMSAPSELVASMTADLRGNEPGVNRDGSSDMVVGHIVEGLVGQTDKGEFKPLLAKDIFVSEDGLSYTFKLRENVRFHDGARLTSEQVVWSIKRYLDPKTRWTCLADFNGDRKTKIEAVEASEEYTVVIRINSPTAVFLASMSRPECGYSGIMSKTSVDAKGSFLQPVGTGPFKWGEWKRGEYLTLKKFPDYVSPENDGTPDGLVGSKRPLVDQVKFMIIPDGSTVKAGLEAGILHSVPLAPEVIADFKDHPKARIVYSPNNSKNLLYMQTKDKVLSNSAIRRAMAAALDLDELVAAASNGTATASASLMPTNSIYYSEAQKERIPHNLEQAKEGLRKAGYNGEPIVITANRRAEIPSYSMAVMAQAMLQRAGLNVKLEIIDYATQVEKRRSGNYQIIAQQVAPRFDPVFAYSFYVGDKSKDPSLMWDNPLAIEMVGKAYVEASRDKRQAVFDRFHKLMLQDMPGIFLYDAVDIWGVSKRVSGTPVWQGASRLWEVSLGD